MRTGQDGIVQICVERATEMDVVRLPSFGSFVF